MKLKQIIVNEIFIIAVVILAFFIQLYYLIENKSPMHWDPSYYTAQTMRVAREIAASPIDGLINTAVYNYFYYPPGYFITTACAFLLFGYKISIGIAWQILYLLATIILIYKVSVSFTNKRLSALAAFMFLCFPVVLGLGRMVYIENLLATQLILFIYLYLKDTEMKDYRVAALCGLVAGWGQLTKWQFIVFAFPIVLINLIKRIKNFRTSAVNSNNWHRLFSWLAIAFSSFSFIALPWYYFNLIHVLEDVHYNAYVRVMGSEPLYYLSSIFFYLQSLPWQMVGLPISIIIFFALIASIKKPNMHGVGADLTLSIIISITLMTFVTHKQGRFIMPLLTLLPIVVVLWLSKLSKIARSSVVVFILLTSSINAIAQTFDLSNSIPELSLPIGFGRKGYLIRYGTPDWILPPITKANWRLDEIFNLVAVNAKTENIKPTVSWHFKEGGPYYDESTLSSYASAYAQETAGQETANFYIYRLPVTEFETNEHKENTKNLSQLGSWTLPDGGEARLYRRHN